MSLFGDEDAVNDLLNDDLRNYDDLPGDNEDETQLFDTKDENTDGVKVEPKKRLVRNPRLRLTVETLSGPRGLHTIEDYFQNIGYKGKGYEKQDLDEIMKRLQHWGHRMYPTYKFDDVLSKIEVLGKKKPLQVHMSRYRLGLLESLKQDKDALEDGKEIEEETDIPVNEVYDEFDALLDEQIAISKIAPRTPQTSSSKYTTNGDSFSNINFTTPSFSKENAAMSTPLTHEDNFNNKDKPLPQTQASTGQIIKELTSEQMSRIAENRRLAQERLAKRLEQLNEQRAGSS
uniref:TIMELESS-interacting protein n=1 Tax=Glossina morsitans morsitans TaxID=37546 RepID=A0A1B0G068_GLOMM